jgi:hypothetical protein
MPHSTKKSMKPLFTFKEVAVAARTGLTVTHQLLANRAQVYLKLGQLTNAKADCTAIIQENDDQCWRQQR